MEEVFPSLLPKIAIILKAFYDNDILEEESIFEWADKVCCDTCSVHVLTARFVLRRLGCSLYSGSVILSVLLYVMHPYDRYAIGDVQ